MGDEREKRMMEALTRMAETDLQPEQGVDISRLIRRLLQRQEEIQRQLGEVVSEMDQVAALLREQADRPGDLATQARDHIALDFAEGAQAMAQARAVLVQATRELEYLRYRLL